MPAKPDGPPRRVEPRPAVVVLLRHHPVEPDGARAELRHRRLPHLPPQPAAPVLRPADVEPEEPEVLAVPHRRDAGDRRALDPAHQETARIRRQERRRVAQARVPPLSRRPVERRLQIRLRHRGNAHPHLLPVPDHSPALPPQASRAGISPRSALPTMSPSARSSRREHRLPAKPLGQHLLAQHPRQQPAAQRRGHQRAAPRDEDAGDRPVAHLAPLVEEQHLVDPRRQGGAGGVVDPPLRRLHPQPRIARRQPRLRHPHPPRRLPRRQRRRLHRRPSVQRHRQPHPERRRPRHLRQQPAPPPPRRAEPPAPPRPAPAAPDAAAAARTRPPAPSGRSRSASGRRERSGEARFPQGLLILRRGGRIRDHPAADVQHRLTVRDGAPACGSPR